MSSDAVAHPAEDGSVPAIRVRDVVKHYLMFDRPEDRLKQMVVPRIERLLGRPPRRYFRDFAALGGISFDIPKGQTVGIVGRNGSGKSTLLQIVCGTLAPTHGSAEVNGRIAALLELGAGFNPDFSGRENVYLYASILGLPRREMEWRFEHIARFADIGPFMDQPVRTYSSGMYVRLAFATATNVDPDILIVDEALAVGDEAFQRKCFARIEEISARGGTILFVSHGAQTIVQLCDRALLLDSGELLLDGPPKAVVKQYQLLLNASPEVAEDIRHQMRTSSPNSTPAEAETSIGETPPVIAEVAPTETQEFFDPHMSAPARVEYQDRGARIQNIRIETQAGAAVNNVARGRYYYLRYDVEFFRDADAVGFGFAMSNVSGLILTGAGTSRSRALLLPQVSHGERYAIEFRFLCPLAPGGYFVTAGCSAQDQGDRVFLHRIVDGFMFRVMPEAEDIETGLVAIDARPLVRKILTEAEA